MPNRFFDTSALVKLYHKESGSEFMVSIAAEPQNWISRLSLAEIESVFAIRTRTATMNPERASDGLRTLDAIQLAVGLELAEVRGIRVFVASDQRLSRVSPSSV